MHQRKAIPIMTPTEIHLLCNEAAQKLSEQAENVQIMVTWNEEGLTHRYFVGAGNWYSRVGLAHEFLAQDIAQTNAKQIADSIHPPDEE